MSQLSDRAADGPARRGGAAEPRRRFGHFAVNAEDASGRVLARSATVRLEK
jgi:hypothetical protein